MPSVPKHDTHAPVSDAEERVSSFYNTVGWIESGGVTEDARRFEDLRECAKHYVSQCRLRVTRHVGAGERLLDMASGPIQFPEYLTYSAGFKKRWCVDLSADALREAERKIGDHGVYLHGSFLDLDLEDNSFDAAVSVHTIFHIDKDRQEEAVRKLLRVTRPGKPVIIVYHNPQSFPDALLAVRRLARRVFGRGDPARALYFFPHRLWWFRRFRDEADVRILPWRSLSGALSKVFVPNNRLGRWMLAALFRLEDAFPTLFVRAGQCPMIVLTKRASQ